MDGTNLHLNGEYDLARIGFLTARGVEIYKLNHARGYDTIYSTYLPTSTIIIVVTSWQQSRWRFKKAHTYPPIETINNHAMNFKLKYRKRVPLFILPRYWIFLSPVATLALYQMPLLFNLQPFPG